jgi:hypothetical protein
MPFHGCRLAALQDRIPVYQRSEEIPAERSFL